MGRSKLTKLKQFQIDKPCPEDWDKMAGDDQKRFCAGCGCFVNNLSDITSGEIEELLSRPERVCVRATCHPQRGVLTRDGWIPRLLLAGAIAASASGCEPTTGDVSVPTDSPVKSSVALKSDSGAKNDSEFMGFVSPIAGVTDGGARAIENSRASAPKKSFSSDAGDSTFAVMGDFSSPQSPERLRDKIKEAELNKKRK